MSKKVSFDYDKTLSKKSVRKYVRSLIKRGFEVWICTSRNSNEIMNNSFWNHDLFRTAYYLGIKKEHVIFTCMENKSVFLKDQNFIFHMDDDPLELFRIETDTDVIPILCHKDVDWKRLCEKTINK